MAPVRPPPDAPRRPYRRIARVTKLPKMNNSERGKYYRQKYKEHEIGLEHSITKLRKQVHDLELFLRVKDELAFRNPYDSCERIVGMIFEYFVRDRTNGFQYDSSFQGRTISPTPGDAQVQSLSLRASCMGMDMRTERAPPNNDDPALNNFLFFDLLSLEIKTNQDAPVIVLRGMLHVKYTQVTIDRLFPHLFHYQDLLEVLLDKEVEYPCTYHFYCGAGGTFENKVVEADYVHGLQQVIGSLEDVMWLLDGSHRYIRHRDSLEEVLRGPATVALESI